MTQSELQSDSYLSRLDELLQQFITLTKKEYEIHGFVESQPEISEEILEKKKLSNTNKANFELDMMYNKINHISKKNALRKKTKINEVVGQTNQNLINDPDIFNIVSNDKTYKDWKQLTLEEKLTKADEFFQSSHYLEEDQPAYDEAIKTEIIQMITDGKLHLKKDIEYDKINQRIANIPLVKYQIETKSYTLKNGVVNKNIKKLSQNAVHKLMKKK
jgi:hypothetical protein